MECCIARRDDVDRGTGKEEEDDDYSTELDPVLLVHSDISTLLHQIDDLVVQATKMNNTTSKQAKTEVETFRSVLSDMLSSLKPWFPRLQEAISGFHLALKDQKDESLVSNVCPSEKEELYDVESPKPTQFESLVSPSPLVAWRGDHKAEKGRQLFMLTPLPLGKSEFLKNQNASKLKHKTMFPSAAPNQPPKASKQTNNGVLAVESIKTTGLGSSVNHSLDVSQSFVECEPLSSPTLRRKIESELLMTPCLKMSPPRSCALFKPIPESSEPEKQGACRSTCSELEACTNNDSQSSGSSGLDKTDGICSKYPELVGIHHVPITRKTDLESSPVWWFSPPKTCVLLEPGNEKKPMGESTRMVSSLAFQNIKPDTKDGSMSLVVESTPLLKEAESVMTKNRTRAGESTLKKELWTRFEEASMHCNRFSSMTTTKRENKKKGFMEMLEEVCGNEESSEIN